MAEVFGEGLEEDIFDRFEADVGFVEFSSALGLANVNPVGGAVAGCAKAFGVNEGFQQNGFESVAVFPVLRNSPGGARQDRGGEVLDFDPWEDEKAGVVDDPVEVVFSLRGGPADETGHVFARAVGANPVQFIAHVP